MVSGCPDADTPIDDRSQTRKCLCLRGRNPKCSSWRSRHFCLCLFLMVLHQALAFSTSTTIKKPRLPINVSPAPLPRRWLVNGSLRLAQPQSLSPLEGGDDSSSDNANTIENGKHSYHWTRQNIAIAVPALIGMLADPLLSLMDTAYVGHLGSLELASLGPCTSLFHLAFNTFRATTAATTSLVAGSLQNSDSDARNVTAISLKLGLSIGFGLLVTLLFAGNFALRAMGVGTTSPLHPAASSYLFTRIWAAPAVLFIGVAEGAFRGYSNTVVPLVASMTAAAINLILDPLLMFKPIGWGVAGAAAATALSQFGAAAVYVRKLIQNKMLPSSRDPKPGNRERSPLNANPQETASTNQQSTSQPAVGVVRSILKANVAMFAKQGSLLFGWAFASRKATTLGPAHVAAHQVGLSVWLVFALIMDGAAVSAQVLMSRIYAQKDKRAATSLIRYMLKFAVVQGIASMLVLDGIDLLVPTLFTSDAEIQGHLHQLMPSLALQQILVSLTLVVESLAAGGNQFQLLAVGTTAATIASIWQISLQTTVEGIWGFGITALFAGRLLTACGATWRVYRQMGRPAIPNSSPAE